MILKFELEKAKLMPDEALIIHLDTTELTDTQVIKISEDLKKQASEVSNNTNIMVMPFKNDKKTKIEVIPENKQLIFKVDVNETNETILEDLMKKNISSWNSLRPNNKDIWFRQNGNLSLIPANEEVLNEMGYEKIDKINSDDFLNNVKTLVSTYFKKITHDELNDKKINSIKKDILKLILQNGINIKLINASYNENFKKIEYTFFIRVNEFCDWQECKCVLQNNTNVITFS
jgi:hypothetical protein